MLVFITGVSTSGKSTVARKLNELGYKAYDTEHNGISAWHNKATGKLVAKFGEMPERTPLWLSEHHWLISKKKIIEIAHQSQNTTVFLCGGGANEQDIRQICDKVIWLKTDEATIRKRVIIPRDHDYGTRPHELTKAISDNAMKEAEYVTYGATIIDARKPIVDVVRIIEGLVTKS